MLHNCRYILLSFIVLLPLLGACQSKQAQNAAANGQQTTQPAPRTKEYPWMTVSRWYEMHSQDVAIASSEQVELLFIGDSITESWDWGEGRDEVYQAYFGQYDAANFGIGGDETQNLLWRLQHNLDGKLDPAVVVVMIGVNNFLQAQFSPPAVAAGVQKVIEQTQTNYPSAKLLLLGILPFHQRADSPSRAMVDSTNERIATFADNERVFYVNVNEQFLDEQGNIPKALMDDYIHPTAAGLEVIAQAVAPKIQPWIAEHRERISKNGEPSTEVQATP